jgi:cytidyltransferase-like protein
MKIGYIPGVFDIFHHGHICLIEKSLEHCDKLVIGVHTDIFVKSYKNTSKLKL